MILNRLSLIIFLSISILAGFIACDTDDDFTSGTFYPDLPMNDPDTGKMEEDTMVVHPPGACWDSIYMTRPDFEFNERFTRYGGGWTGGDATYSIPLPDGRTIWLFGDTFLGTVNPDRSRPHSAFIRNSAMVQDGDQMTTLHQGGAGNASAFVSPSESDWWYWPGHGIAGDSLQVIMFGFRSTGGGGGFDFAYTSVDLATFSLPDIKLMSLERKIADPTINFGAAVLEHGGYTYLYGAEKDGLGKYLHAARVEGNDLSSEWQYFDGENWTADISKSTRLFAHVSEQFSISEFDGKFYLLTQAHILGAQIYLLTGDSPVGPFYDQRLVYCTPQLTENTFTYNAFLHRQFSDEEEVLISYNINSFDFNELFENADLYRPYFIRVKNWQE